MHIRTEQGDKHNRPTVITVITNDGMTHYFVECLFNGETEGYIQVYTIADVTSIINGTKQGITDSIHHYKGHWFFDYEGVCRWINNHCDVDENVTEENY